MNNLAIDVHNLTKVFGDKTVVDHISLQVPRGSVFGFLGSNGSGKTTTIRMICGLLTPTEGSGQCLGYNIRTESKLIKSKIGYMPQKFSFYDKLSCEQNLCFIGEVYGIKNLKTAIEAMLCDLELDAYRAVSAANLSGGLKQRLALACCLLHQPALVFLDEPTAGVDPKARKDFWDYLHKISVRDGTTILVTTHYMDEAEKCTQLAYINLGKLLYSGITRDIIPFSQIKSYRVDCDRPAQTVLIESIAADYPRVMASVVNNDLRISSRDAAALDAVIDQNPEYQYQAVTPNFEEVFIGLIS